MGRRKEEHGMEEGNGWNGGRRKKREIGIQPTRRRLQLFSGDCAYELLRKRKGDIRGLTSEARRVDNRVE